MSNKEFQKSETWRKRSKTNTFCVEVVHWFDPEFVFEGYSREETHHWNVYAIVWDNHPAFASMVGKKMLDGPFDGYTLHGGCSFSETIYDREAKPIRVKFGCDYSHYGDDYEQTATADDAWPVFADALTLFNELESQALEGK